MMSFLICTALKVKIMRLLSENRKKVLNHYKKSSPISKYMNFIIYLFYIRLLESFCPFHTHEVHLTMLLLLLWNIAEFVFVSVLSIAQTLSRKRKAFCEGRKRVEKRKKRTANKWHFIIIFCRKFMHARYYFA